MFDPGSIGWLYISIICLVGFVLAELGKRKEGWEEVKESEPGQSNLTAKQLMEMAKGKTDLARDQLVRPYQGQLKEVTGTVKDVDDLYRTFTVFLQAEEQDFEYLVHVRMKKKHKERLLTLTKGEKVTLIGQLRSFSANGLSLENGEFA